MPFVLLFIEGTCEKVWEFARDSLESKKVVPMNKNPSYAPEVIYWILYNFSSSLPKSKSDLKISFLLVEISSYL